MTGNLDSMKGRTKQEGSYREEDIQADTAGGRGEEESRHGGKHGTPQEKTMMVGILAPDNLAAAGKRVKANKGFLTCAHHGSNFTTGHRPGSDWNRRVRTRMACGVGPVADSLRVSQGDPIRLRLHKMPSRIAAGGFRLHLRGVRLDETRWLPSCSAPPPLGSLRWKYSRGGPVNMPNIPWMWAQ